VASSTLPRGRALPAGELRALFAACAGDGPAGARDAALFSMLYGAGLRRSEAVALDLGNLDTTTGAVTILAGKGRKDRIAYLPSGGIAALADWLAVRGDRPGPLFWPVRKDGVLQPRRMSDQAVLKIVAKRARGAGVARSPALLLAWARREADRQFAEGPVIDAEDLPF
jgi:integrase/recombinase XerD